MKGLFVGDLADAIADFIMDVVNTIANFFIGLVDDLL